MFDHAKENYFGVIEFTMRANESCLDEFEFRKTIMKVLTLIECLQLCRFMDLYNYADLWRVHFAQLNADWRL